MWFQRKEAEAIREVPFGTLKDDQLGNRFPENTVKTSKYTLATFLPKNLFEQLRKAANFYFLLLSLVLFVGERTNLFMESLKAYSTFLTLAFMMSASAVMAALDDYNRHKSDVQMNSQLAWVLQAAGDLIQLTWAEVKVGDVLLVKSEEEFPADIVPLCCSGEEGHCYVSTANLDGETNLKLKAAAPATQTALCGGPVDFSATTPNGELALPARAARSISKASATSATGTNTPKIEIECPLLDRAVNHFQHLGGVISAEPPQASIHNFTGSFSVHGGASLSLGAKQLLLRGTRLRNTVWVLGVAVYTGRDTRVVMNSKRSTSKLSNLERVINVSMLVFLVAQLAMAIVTNICFNITKDEFNSYWYLYPGGPSSIILPDIIGYLITFFGLYSNLIPISLYFTCEMCNAAQSFFISCDLGMYCKEFEAAAMVRSTNLCQEIGQVAYIFSDKTGTLTQNVMELKMLSIAGQVYGKVTEEKGFHGAAAIKEARQNSPKDSDAIAALLEVLAVSHTVMATYDHDGKVVYEAESPDEDALVTTAGELGWRFTGRIGTNMMVDTQEDVVAVRKTYQVLALNAFTAARKRMSVLVRREGGDIVLLVKGADNIMMQKALRPDTVLDDHLTQFAQEGLRTLVIGSRAIPESEFLAWQKTYEKAQNAMQDRDQLLAECAEQIEVKLELLGATAIEDKLQVGVAQTITRLREAGIKLWVLTGDKMETARNIGFSTRVLSDDMEIFVLDLRHDDKEGELEAQMKSMVPCVRELGAPGRKEIAGMMVTGQSLEFMLGSRDLESLFLEIVERCSVVIACRVSPLQKAELVKLVRTRVVPTPVTLAVGDGANDVPMIQEAQVGVGICGREGRQAVNAADFAIAQFRFLQRLLLVHGRLNYRRACKFTLYTFWRNAVQVFLMFMYSFLSGYSGISLFEDKTRMSFNLITSLPIIATGMFDRDVSDDVILEHPILYEVGRLGRDLNPKRMVECCLSAAVHAVFILLSCLAVYPSMDLHEAGDYYTWGTAVYTCLIMVCSYRVAFLTQTWNFISAGTLLLSVVGYIIFLMVYGAWHAIEPPMYSAPYHMASNLPFWFGLIAVLCVAVSIDGLCSWVLLQFLPDPKDLILENISTGRLQKVTGPVAETQRISQKSTSQMSHQSSTSTSHSDRQNRSSFVFDHPSEVPRNHNSLSKLHPKAGDTSLIDAKPCTIGQEGRSTSQQWSLKANQSLPPVDQSWSSAGTISDTGNLPTAKLLSFGKDGRPPEFAFAQQKLRSRQVQITWKKSLAAPLVACFCLMLLAVITMVSSQSVEEVRIQYDGKADNKATVRHVCAAGSHGQTTSCTFDVAVTKDMEPPILVSYVIDPFYQNYLPYVLAVVNSELEGEKIQSSSRGACKDTNSDKTRDGQDIVPCGVRATSFFNDTFEIVGIPIDQKGIAWKTDVERFANPSDFPARTATSWLHERYPTIVAESEGVRNEHFVNWMRPEALPRVTKTYGNVRTKLTAGQIITLRINASFPVSGLEATKELVLTTYNVLGGKNAAFVTYLWAASGTIAGLSVLFLSIQAIRPRPLGDPRFSTGDPKFSTAVL